MNSYLLRAAVLFSFVAAIYAVIELRYLSHIDIIKKDANTALSVAPNQSLLHTIDAATAGVTKQDKREHIFQDASQAWANVDLKNLQKNLPDNAFWALAAPTEDTEILSERAQERAYWNQAFNKINADESTPEEIHQYYDYKQKISEDFIGFLTVLADTYGDKLSPDNLQLVALTISLHSIRQQSIPTERSNALQSYTLAYEKKIRWQENPEAYDADMQQELLEAQAIIQDNTDANSF